MKIKIRMYKEAFTLIEMLVVIAIIALLASLIVPVVGRAQTSAKEVACASNLRQCGQALFAYATDHKGKLPYPTTEYNLDRFSAEFIEDLEPYIGDYKVWGCPACGVIPLNSPENTIPAIRGGYQYYPGHFANSLDLSGLNADFPLMQDITYTWQDDWRSNHSKKGKLRTDAVSGSPSFRTFFGGRLEGFNLLSVDGSARWFKWTNDMEGFAWIVSVNTYKTVSTQAVLQSIQDLQ